MKYYRYANISDISLVITFFSLWFSAFFENRVEMYIAYAMILTFGVFHGANDIKLIQRMEDRKGFSVLLVRYVSVVLLCAALFYFIPVIVLSCFIAFSAYHFGEEHWKGQLVQHTRLAYAFFLVYGMMIFAMVFLCNWQSTQDIVAQLTGISVNFIPIKTIFWGLILSTFTLFLYLRTKKMLKANGFRELILLLVLYVLFYNASLIWGFAIYFIFWHSLPSILSQIKFLYGGTSRKDVRSYINSSVLYWVVALSALAGATLFLSHDESLFHALFFAFLAAITFPHVIVIHRMKNH